MAQTSTSTSTSRVSGKRLPLIAAGVLVALCALPVASLFLIEGFLSRDCVTEDVSEGAAGGVLVWRIEMQRCGSGPRVANVLLAPRGKSFALVASATGQPLPVGVERSPDGTTHLILSGESRDGTRAHLLALKSTGRPAKPLVLADGVAKP